VATGVLANGLGLGHVLFRSIVITVIDMRRMSRARSKDFARRLICP
jgi:hypothetical protein